MNINYIRSPVPGTKLVPVKYRVLKPGRMTIRNADGQDIVMGYGIGEIVEIMEPNAQYLIAKLGTCDSLPLADGTTIVGFDPNMEFEHVSHGVDAIL